MWTTIYTSIFAACVFSSVINIGAVTQPKKCPPNELYEVCNPSCPPRYCGVDIGAVSCAPSPKPGDPDCKPGCRCRDGYLRDGNYTCIPERHCPKCPTNEVYDVCPAPCPPRICGVDRLVKCKPPPTYGDPECEPKCRCRDGYYRNSKGKCVTEEECECDKPHEYYEKRIPNCPPQTCKSIGVPYDCPKQVNYTAGCRCEKGYYRNLIGECISEKDCLKCPGEHEYFSCGGACDNVCATLSQQNQTNCPIQNIVCNNMCYCEEGYARDHNNVCIPISKCPKPCGKNERLEKCPATLCSPQSCSQLGYPINCTTLAENEKCPVPPACVCNDRLVRDDKGKCIPRNQCPSCGGDPNAESGCGVNCGKLCSNYKRNDVVCPLVCDPNGCDCKKGYVLDTNINKCVRPEKCTPTCSANEKWDTCKNGGCDKRNCTQIEEPRICIDPIECYGGCVCKEGYLRSKNGTCIPVNQCPESQCKRPNEEFDACPSDCSPGTCESIGKSYSCPAVIYCDPSCVCKKGYYRNLIGECISEKDCLKCRGNHEYWSCGPACDNVCATLLKQSQDNCPIKNVKCTPMCYCEKGYARNSKNECIPIDKCPPCRP